MDVAGIGFLALLCVWADALHFPGFRVFGVFFRIEVLIIVPTHWYIEST